jgi:REP element-mobilizing transposase RayT
VGNNNRPELYTRRSSVRLPGFDYASTGAYFVTVCTEHRKPIFEIPEISKLLVEVWETLPGRFSSVTLDEFIVMPDHIHGILWLDGTVKNAPTLSRVVDAYKSLTTVAWLNYNKARSIWCSKHLWQRGYYDHVIRNDQDLELTREYIRNNPLRLKEIWRDDP